MNWLDYREQLGIGFSDKEKLKMLKVQVFNNIEVDSSMKIATEAEYIQFFNTIGKPIDFTLLNNLYQSEYTRYQEILSSINDCQTIVEFISYFVAYINCIEDKTMNEINKQMLKEGLVEALKESKIPYEIYPDDNNYFYFPKGEPEFDKPLITEPLNWLVKYPKARKTYINALKQYTEGIYVRDVADNLRKCFEEFLQEFFHNSKNLEKNIKEISSYLKEKSVNQDIINMLNGVFNQYKSLNDKDVKHHDLIDKKILEFLLYLTGIFIRMIVTI